MAIPTKLMKAIPVFNNIHRYFESAKDLQEFLKELPADKYPEKKLRRLRLIPELETWLEQRKEDHRTFFGITFLHPVGPDGRWRRAELFRCLAIKMADGKLYGFTTTLMIFERA